MQVMTESRGAPSSAKRPGGWESAGQLAALPTMKRCRLPSERTTTTLSPGRSLFRPAKTRGDPGSPTWPSTTASPGALGAGPRLYQPTFQTFWGVPIAPERSRPTESTDASMPRTGMRSRTGGLPALGPTGACAGEGWAAAGGGGGDGTSRAATGAGSRACLRSRGLRGEVVPVRLGALRILAPSREETPSAAVRRTGRRAAGISRANVIRSRRNPIGCRLIVGGCGAAVESASPAPRRRYYPPPRGAAPTT